MSKRYFITGAGGFVGQYLSAYLLSQGHEVVGLDTLPVAPALGQKRGRFSSYQFSMLDDVKLRALLGKVKPDLIVHLASASSVGLSWQTPVACFVNNTQIFMNLVEAMRALKLNARLLSIGSSEQYGSMPKGQKVFVETDMPRPTSPYAVARVAQEQISDIYTRGYGLDILCTRSFNHIGPGQKDQFVVSSFVKQAVAVSLKLQPTISCGRLDIVRDFLDVRDVVRAYDLILMKGKTGHIYNVCAGKGVTLKDILSYVCRKLSIHERPKQDKQLVRPLDNRVIVGSNAKLRALGFKPRISLEQTLDDMVAHWLADMRQ